MSHSAATVEGGATERWRDLLLMLVAMAHLSMQGIVATIYPVFSTELADELNLTASQVGLLMSAYSFGYALTQLPAGLLTARYGAYRTMIGSMAIMGLSGLIFAAFPQYYAIMIARILAGVGAAFSIPAGAYLLSQAMSGKKLSRGLGVFGSGWGAGTMFAFYGLSLVVASAGWRPAMLVVALVGGVLVLFIAFGLRGKAPQETSQSFRSLLPPGSRRVLVWNSGLLYLILIALSATSAITGMVTWAPSFLQSSLSSGPVLANSMTGVLGVVWFFSSLLSGPIAERLGKSRVIYSSMIGCLALPILFPLFRNEVAAVILLLLLGWFTMFWFGPVVSQIPRFVPANLTSTATGLYNSAAWFGAFPTPYIMGLALDRTGDYFWGFAVMSLVGLLGVFGAIALRVQHSIEPVEESGAAPGLSDAH